jgi:hypothetical protein
MAEFVCTECGYRFEAPRRRLVCDFICKIRRKDRRRAARLLAYKRLEQLKKRHQEDRHAHRTLAGERDNRGPERREH